MMTHNQLEDELQSLSSKVTLAKILVYGSIAVMILCFFVRQVLLAVLFLVFALIGKSPLKKYSNRLKEFLGDNVVSSVLNEVFDNVDYNPFGKTESIRSAGMVFPFSVDKVQGSDHIKATYKGLQVELSDIKIYEKYYDGENGTQEHMAFQGQWLICDFGKELSSDVRFSANNKRLRKRHKKDRVEMGNWTFNELRQKVLSELKWFTDIIDTLRAEDTF